MAGNVTFNYPKDNYQRVPKAIICDPDIDIQTLGIYVKVLGLGTKWDLNVHGLSVHLRISEERIRRAFGELEKRGYLRRLRSKNAAGRFDGYDYEIGIDLLEKPCAENTGVGENRTPEKPDSGKSGLRKNRTPEKRTQYIDNNQIEDFNKTSHSKGISISAGGREFDFYEALRGLGVSDETAEDWRKVRRSLKACDTRTAFNLIAEEIARAGKSAEDCVRLAAANSWRGFRAAWIREENSPRPSYPTGERRRLSNYEKALIAQDEEFGTHAYQDFCHEREERRRASAAASQPDDQ